MAQTMATRKGCWGSLKASSTLTRVSPHSKPCFMRARWGMMSIPHFRKSETSFCPSLTMNSTMVSSIHFDWPCSQANSLAAASRSSASVKITRSVSNAAMAAFTAVSLACQRGAILCHMRPQVILSMQTNMHLPDSQRVAQCSTKSPAILSSRSPAVMTS